LDIGKCFCFFLAIFRFAANADDGDVAAAAAGRAVQPRGLLKQAALKDQRYRTA
jgi:hypothetical protein